MVRGIYAHVDEQGRLVLSPELLKELGVTPGDRISLEASNHEIHLRPPLTTLRRVYIELTNRCNMNCSTCMRNVWDVEYGCLAAQTFERILQGMQSFSPRPEIFFGGYGEPLFHPGCFNMLERAKSLGFRASIITNGVLLTEEMSRRLIETGLDMLWVSLDGASPECYTDVRLGNTLPLILENLKQLHVLLNDASGIFSGRKLPKLGIAFVAMQRNIQDLPDVIRLGIQLGASEFSVSNVLAHNPALNAENLYARSLDRLGGLSTKQWKPQIHLPRMDVTTAAANVIVELLAGDYRLDLFGSVLDGSGDRCPFIERRSLSVRWDGKVSPCLPLLYTHTHYLDNRLRTSQAYFLGNINEKDLPAIWNDPVYLALRERLEEFDFSPCVTCNSCEMVDQNLEDCFGNVHPSCGACLWAQGLIRCP